MKNVTIMGAIICHYVLVGADAFGQLVVASMALSAPPASLAMYHGDYVYDSALFWQTLNVAYLVVLVAALAVHWRSPRRNLLLMTLASIIAISVVSLGYIFPEYNAIVSSEFSDTVDLALVERAASWRSVALLRLSVMAILGIAPLMALTKPSS